MNKIVRTHYPASRLPDDIRADLPPNSQVTIMLEDAVEPVRKTMTEERLQELLATAERRLDRKSTRLNSSHT